MYSKTISLTDTEVIDNGNQASKASHSSCEDFDEKYALKIHVSSKKSDKIQLAKSAISNTRCISQNRPLFGFIPIYGLKGRVYDNKNNSECTDLLLLHNNSGLMDDTIMLVYKSLIVQS